MFDGEVRSESMLNALPKVSVNPPSIVLLPMSENVSPISPIFDFALLMRSEPGFACFPTPNRILHSVTID